MRRSGRVLPLRRAAGLVASVADSESPFRCPHGTALRGERRMRRPDLPCDPSDIYVGASAAMLRAAAQRRQGPGSSGIAKRHGSCGDETALCGKRRLCSPGLACDPSSGHMLASTARLEAAVQGLQGPGSRPVPLRAAHDPDRPTAVVRLTLRAGTTLTRRCELRAAATTWLRRARVFLFLACASRGWLGSIRRPEVTCAADKARRHRRRCDCCDEALGAANCGGLVRTLDRRNTIEQKSRVRLWLSPSHVF